MIKDDSKYIEIFGKSQLGATIVTVPFTNDDANSYINCKFTFFVTHSLLIKTSYIELQTRRPILDLKIV